MFCKIQKMMTPVNGWVLFMPAGTIRHFFKIFSCLTDIRLSTSFTFCWKLSTNNFCTMEEIQNGSLTVCSRSSSTFSPPLSKATELSGNDASNKEREEENSGKPLSCSEPFVDVNLPYLDCFVRNVICPRLF